MTREPGAWSPEQELIHPDSSTRVRAPSSQLSAMHGTLTIAHLTLHEARRRKVLTAALLLGLAFLTVFGLGFHFINNELVREAAEGKGPPQQADFARNFIIMAGLYAANFLIVMTSVLMPVDTLSGEIGSGAIQTLVTKPIRRSEVVLGKWLGYLAILAGYVALMAGGVLLVARAISGFTPQGVHVGVPLMLLEGTLLMTVTVAGGTRLSTLANGVLGFGLYGVGFIGWWMEQAGTMLGNATTRSIGIVASLVVPSEALWGLAAYNMQPPMMRQLNLTPFSPASVPSALMVAWAVGYTLVVLLLAVWSFRRRSL
jgi:Cu-processing system permease protein